MTLPKILDLRRGEGGPFLRAVFAVFLLIAVHTTIETARDVLLLTRVPASHIGLAYLAVALGCIPVVAMSTRVSARVGSVASLRAGFVVAAGMFTALSAAPLRTATILAIYVASGLVGAVLVPLLWTVLGAVFTIAQGRRLLGTVAAAGLLGGVAGASAAATLLRSMSAQHVILVAAALLLPLVFVVPAASGSSPRTLEDGQNVGLSRLLRSEPFVRRIAALAALSTVVLVLSDFFFKWTVARDVPPEQLGAFVAGFYAKLNIAALAVQFLTSRVLFRHVGVATTLAITPLLILSGACVAVATGGAFLSVVGAKGVEGTLRYSVHRTTTELTYLPLSHSVRLRAKPVIEGALARVVQGVVGAVLLGLGASGRLSPMWLAVGLLLVSASWLALAWTMRRPYLAVLRRGINGAIAGPSMAVDPLDFESAEALVESLSNDDPFLVVGAMNALAQRGRDGLIPALVLLHSNESVLARALAIFGSSERSDWVGGARKLLHDDREAVRTAAARALASRGALDAKDLRTDTSPFIRGYALVHLALRGEDADALETASVREAVATEGDAGELARLGMLSMMSDAPPDPRLRSLLEVLAERISDSPRATIELARAIRSQKAVGLVPWLTRHLSTRDGREDVRTALLAFGDAAVVELARELRDPASPQLLRVHIPNTLARFGTARASDVLLRTIEDDPDGLVRYKAIRALGRLVAERGLAVDRVRVERLALRNLVEHVRLLGLRAPFDSTSLEMTSGVYHRRPTERILLGLLNDKLRQSLERAFRLLKIAYPKEDIHRMHNGYLSADPRERANGAEFMGTLLHRREQSALRDILMALGEASVEDVLAVARSSGQGASPATPEDALHLLVGDADKTLASLAELHVAARAGDAICVKIPRETASLELTVESGSEMGALAYG